MPSRRRSNFHVVPPACRAYSGHTSTGVAAPPRGGMERQMTILGRYELRDKLGQGGFATVYRGWDPRLRREVAVKALSLEWVENQEIAAKFLGEAQRLANLHHPNIVTVFDVGGPEERPFFAMELLEGHTLAQFLTAGR